MLYLDGMRLRRQLTKLIVLLCLLLLQVQVWASVSLPCLHAPSTPDAVSTACPMHGFGGSSNEVDSRANLYDCYRCVIGSCLSVVHGAQASAVPLRILMRGIVAAVPPKHFYRFSPEAVLRPPIVHRC